MLDKRWLLTSNGQSFMRLVAEIIEASRNAGLKSAIVPTNDPAADWDQLKGDFITGLKGVSPIAVRAADELRFKQELDRVYQRRFEDGYDTLDVSKAGTQAVILGQKTGTMMRLHMGDVGDYPKPIPRAQLTLDLYYLDWARDFIGFWVYGKYRWTTDPTSRLSAFDLLPVEFENGCVFC